MNIYVCMSLCVSCLMLQFCTVAASVTYVGMNTGLVLSTLVCLLVDVEKISAADVLYSLGSETSPLKIDNTTFMGKENTTILEINFAGLKIIGPYAFTKLSNLMKLDLDFNPLESVHCRAFWGLEKLEELSLLDCRFQDFKRLTRRMKRLSKLKILNVALNRITKVEKRSLVYVPDLTVLQLHNNKISRIDEGVFEDTPKLSVLFLSGNPLKSINREMLKGLKSMTGKLHLDRCELTNIQPGIFGHLKYLFQLDISYNKIENISRGSFLGLENLKILFIRNNVIKQLKDEPFNDLARLTEIYLDENMIATIEPKYFKGLDSVRKLDLRGNRLTEIPSKAFAYIPKLRILHLGGNMIDYIGNDAFNGSLELKELHLDSNKLSKMPNLCGMPDLSSLYVSENILRTIDSDEFGCVKLLVRLDLSKNNLTYFPDGAFRELENILLLDLNDNHLTRFSSNSLPQLTGPFRLDLRGNKNLKSESGIDVKSGCPNEIVEKLKSAKNQFCFLY